MFAAILVMAFGAVVLGAALGYAAVRFRVEGDPLVEKIDAILPQTQCGQCGFPGCKPYAQAIAKGEAEINQCPPGGDEGKRTAFELTRQAIGYRMLQLLQLPIESMDDAALQRALVDLYRT